MLFLIALILAFGFAFACHKPLKTHKNIFYVFAIVISIVVATVDFRGLPTFLTNYVIALFSRGALATALWCVVMYANVFPNGSKPIKTLMPIRGELSIFTAILTLGHNIGYGKTYFVRLFTDAQSMSTNQLVASILTITMLLIMLPLTVMSFPSVRKKFNPKTWKKIQRLAYVFYGLIYTHVMVLSIPLAKMGRSGYRFTVATYSLVFIGYAVFRIKKHLVTKKKLTDDTKTNLVCTLTTLALSAIIVVGAKPSSTGTDTPSNEPAVTTAVTTTDTTTVTTVQTTTTTVTTTVSTTDASETSETTEDTSTTSETSTPSESSISETSATTTEATTTQATTITTTEEATQQDNNVYEDNNDSNNDDSIDDGNNDNAQDYNYGFGNNDSYQENNSNDNNNNNNDNNDYQEPEPQPDPEPTYVYNDGTYTGTAYGYDGDVEITITIEHDVITAINGYSYESDPWYFEQASASVYQQILSSQNPNVDAVSGATYSSKAIMSAVQSALDSARR